MLMKYIAGLQKLYLRIFYPPPPLGIFVCFFFNRKTLNNFSRKLGLSDLYLKRAVFQQRMHVQSSSWAHLKGNFMYFYRMVLTPYRQHGPLL